MTKRLKQTARVLLRGQRALRRRILPPLLLTAGMQVLALGLALHAAAFPLSLRLSFGTGILLLAVVCRSWLLLRQTEASLLCATGAALNRRAKRYAFVRLPLLLSVRLFLLLCACVPAFLLLWSAWLAVQKTYPAVTVLLLVGCGMLMAAVSWRFFRAAASLLELTPHLLLSGVSFPASVRLSVQSLSARRGPLFRLRRSFLPWKAASLFLLPLPFARRYYQLAFTLFALSPDFT